MLASLIFQPSASVCARYPVVVDCRIRRGCGRLSQMQPSTGSSTSRRELVCATPAPQEPCPGTAMGRTQQLVRAGTISGSHCMAQGVIRPLKCGHVSFPCRALAHRAIHQSVHTTCSVSEMITHEQMHVRWYPPSYSVILFCRACACSSVVVCDAFATVSFFVPRHRCRARRVYV